MALVLDTKKKRKAKSQPDPELLALATVLRALQTLSPDQRQRVVDYATRWVEAQETIKMKGGNGS